MKNSRGRPRIYLDNAATSWPKPATVIEAIENFYRHQGAAAARSTYAAAESIGKSIHRLRERLRQLIQATRSSEIIFAFNGTDSLNTALLGLPRHGQHVVTTQAEHNSVLRPLRQLEQEQVISLSIVDCDSVGRVEPDQVLSALRPNTSLVAVTHASNVTGALNPIDEVGSLCQEREIPLLIDAAQTLGYVPIDVRQSSFPMLAAPGHKGLGGPLGTGVLYLPERLQSQVRPLRFGGTGSESHLATQPDYAPDRFESGNLNVGGLLGLLAAVESRQPADADWRNTELFGRFQRLLESMRTIEGVTVFAPQSAAEMVPVLSFAIDGLDPREGALLLDGNWGIECRAGFHCAPLMAKQLGVDHAGGTLRFSPGRFTTDAEIETAIAAIEQLAVVGQNV